MLYRKGRIYLQCFPQMEKRWLIYNDFKSEKNNDSVAYHKLKMNTLESVTQLVNPGCFMASIDLKDAYLRFILLQSTENTCGFCGETKCFSLLAYQMV